MAATYSVNTAFNAIDNVSSKFRRMGAFADKFGKKASNSVNRVNTQTSMLGSVIGGNLIAGGISRGTRAIGSGIGFIVNEARKIEDATAAFTPLLGGVDKATELVSMLNKTSATTPFQFEDISKSAKQLLPVMNGDIQKVTDTFRMLGDTAGGNAQKLDSITRGFTKAMLKGKVDMESLNMIGEAGVPIFTELADSMGTEANAAFFKMISAGKVTTQDLTNAFQKMTSEGGIFFNGMIIASKTTSGVFSTLKDVVAVTAGEIGLKLLPTIKDVSTSIIDLLMVGRDWIVQNDKLIQSKVASFVEGLKNAFATMWPILKGIFNVTVALWPQIKFLAGAFLLWDTAILLVNIGLKGMAILGIIGKIMQFAKVIIMITKAKGIWAAAQRALNFAMKANPIGLIFLGISALIGVIVLLVKNWDVVKEAMKATWSVIRQTGAIIFSALVFQLRAVLFLLSKIPGIGGFAKSGLEGLDAIQSSIAGDGPSAPNQSREDGRRSDTEAMALGSGQIDVNVSGSGADVQTRTKRGSRFNFNQNALGVN